MPQIDPVALTLALYAMIISGGKDPMSQFLVKCLVGLAMTFVYLFIAVRGPLITNFGDGWTGMQELLGAATSSLSLGA